MFDITQIVCSFESCQPAANEFYTLLALNYDQWSSES